MTWCLGHQNAHALFSWYLLGSVPNHHFLKGSFSIISNELACYYAKQPFPASFIFSQPRRLFKKIKMMDSCNRVLYLGTPRKKTNGKKIQCQLGATSPVCLLINGYFVTVCSTRPAMMTILFEEEQYGLKSKLLSGLL